MASDIPPDRGGRAQPAPRRRAGGSRGRGGEKTEGSARSGESRFFADATSGLPRLPLDANARRCQGRNEQCGPRAGLSAGCAAAEKDKRSSSASAETAAGWLRALRIERGPQNGRWPMALSKKITDAGKKAVTHEAPENPTAQLGSAGFLRLATAHRRGRFAAAAAAPSSRRCGWITVFTTGKRSLREGQGREEEARPILSCSPERPARRGTA